jgi:hypothetical protein
MYVCVSGCMLTLACPTQKVAHATSPAPALAHWHTGTLGTSIVSAAQLRCFPSRFHHPLAERPARPTNPARIAALPYAALHPDYRRLNRFGKSVAELKSRRSSRRAAPFPWLVPRPKPLSLVCKVWPQEIKYHSHSHSSLPSPLQREQGPRKTLKGQWDLTPKPPGLSIVECKKPQNLPSLFLHGYPAI